MNDVQHKLDASKAINVKDIAAEKRDFLKGLDINSIDLSKLPNPKDNENSIQLNLVDVYGDRIDTSRFESFVNNMKGLNKEQISTLQNSLLAASETLKNSQTESDTYGMRICQTNLELKYISEKLVPEQSQDQFNSFVNDYTQQLSDNYVGYLTNFANQLANRTDPVSIQMGWQEKGKEMLDSLKNGSDNFQMSEHQYQYLYNTVDVTNSDKVKEQLDSVYKNILSNNGAYPGVATKPSLVKEIKYLSEAWNKVMDTIGDQRNKFTTEVDWFA